MRRLFLFFLLLQKKEALLCFDLRSKLFYRRKRQLITVFTIKE